MHRSLRCLQEAKNETNERSFSNATTQQTTCFRTRPDRRNTGRFGRASEGRATAGRVPHAPRQPRVGRFVRRGPQGKRLQPRARVPALERLPHTRWRQVVDYHGIGPFCDHAFATRRILGPNKFLKKRRLKQMNATMVASGTKAVPRPVSSIQDIPLAKIRESKTNPRRFFDEAKLAELADFVPGNKIRVMWRNPLCGVQGS